MAEKLWGGRFSKKTDERVEKFTRSIHFDYKLAKYDVFGSICHVQILKKMNFLNSEEAKRLDDALNEILENIKQKGIEWDKNCEDIHTNIQNKLKKKVGDLVLKLHTARSRNDQVVFATKFYCKDEISALTKEINELILAIIQLAKKNSDIIIPGFTHLQHAQPVYLEDYLDAYKAMLSRDSERLQYISNNIKITMGAGALAGTPIKSEFYNLKADEFLKLTELDKSFNINSSTNSLDAVSDRDFVIEIISALSIIAMHLSRLSEDLIIWSTKEFDFIDIDDAFCTGSSLMPQKKNPDVLELVRGYAGRLYGNLVSVLVMMKGLPLSYNRDMQLDKEPLFDSFEIVQKELEVLSELFKNVTFKKENIDKQLEDECLYATDLADYLVQNKVPFKEAHHTIGRLIQYKLEKNTEIRSLDAETLKKFHPLLTPAVVKKIINPEYSVKSKKSVRR